MDTVQIEEKVMFAYSVKMNVLFVLSTPGLCDWVVERRNTEELSDFIIIDNNVKSIYYVSLLSLSLLLILD